MEESAISLITFAVAVFFYTCSQVITFGKFRLKSDFWQNWNRKYKEPKEKAPSTWYYKFAVLKYSERFPGSGTVFVALTDGYHLSQLLFKVSLIVSLVFYRPWLGWWDAIIYFTVWQLVFNVTNRIVSE